MMTMMVWQSATPASNLAKCILRIILDLPWQSSLICAAKWVIYALIMYQQWFSAWLLLWARSSLVFFANAVMSTTLSDNQQLLKSLSSLFLVFTEYKARTVLSMTWPASLYQDDSINVNATCNEISRIFSRGEQLATINLCGWYMQVGHMCVNDSTMCS